jgi:hypothetical protein
MLFTIRSIQRPKPKQVLGEPVAWFETAEYLGMTLDTRLTWSAHINQVGRKAAQRLSVLGPLLNMRNGLSIRNGVLLYKQLIRPVMDYACPVWRSAARSQSGSCKCYNPSVFTLRPTLLVRSIAGKFTRIWDSFFFFFFWPHQIINWELRLKFFWCGEPLSSAT